MASSYNFKKITVIPTASELKEVCLSKTQRKTPTVVHRQYSIGRIRAFYARKIKFLQQTLHDKLTQIIDEFPKMEEVHPFYADLMNILYDRDHYKIALGQMNTARHLIDGIAREYCRLMKYADSLYRCKMLKRAALGRMVKLLRRQKSSFEYLEQVRQHLSRLPSIDPNNRTLILCGFPNVGKSSFINTVTRADVEVQPYAFTTKALYVGHLDYKFLRWQVIDTPGILDQPLEERNTIEMQAVTALAHLKAAILYVMDISEQCDKTLAEQIHLFDSIRPLFANKPVLVALNKTDIITRAELSPEKEAMLAALEKDGVPLLEMSTVSKTGVVEIRDRACDDLLAQRVETKLQAKKTTVSEGGVLNRVFVAYPEKRDEVVRAPFIPEAVLHRRVKGTVHNAGRGDQIARGLGNMGKAPTKFNVEDASIAEMRDENTRRLEREIELELDDEYVLDLKKNYMLKNEDEKYDVIPEIWNGHNIADFVDEAVQAKMAALLEEEENLKAAGEYDEDLESEDEELAENAQKIADKEEELRFMAREKKSLNGKRTSRSVTRKRDRTMASLEQTMGDLGVEIEPKRMKHLQEMAGKEHTVKKMKVGPSRSLSANRAESRDKLGIRDEKARSKSRVMAKRAQKPMNQESRKGEGDRRFMDLKPKHLFSGKRGSGKTDRR